KVVRPLGQGGQGRVYEVEDLGIYAAPSAPSVEERMKRVLREATAAVYHAESEAAMKELIQLIQELSTTASQQATRPHRRGRRRGQSRPVAWFTKISRTNPKLRLFPPSARLPPRRHQTRGDKLVTIMRGAGW